MWSKLIMCTLITDGTYSTSGEPMKTTAVLIALALSPVALGNSQKEKEPTITTKDHLEEPPVDRIDPTESVVSDVAHNVYSAITHVERIGVVDKNDFLYPGGRLFVTFTKPDSFTLNTVAKGATRLIYDFARWQSEHGKGFYLMTFEGRSNVVDQHGKESAETVLWVDFLQEDLSRVVWKNVDYLTLLNLASSVRIVSRAGNQIFSAFCKENAADARRFCTMARMP